MIIKLRARDPSYPDLTPDQPYLVLGIEADDFRILNDLGRPYLYPRALFSVIDSREPEDWVSELGEDKERYAYPPQFNSSGFFEDFFDGSPEAVTIFWRVMNQRLSAAA